MRLGFDDVSLEVLRRRRSQKWAAVPDDVLPAWVAEMDFPLAPPVRDALLEAIDLDDLGYAHPGRLPEAFAAFASACWGWTVDPSRVWIVPDVMIGVAEVIALLTEPGTGVVVNPPVYPPFFSTVAATGRRIVEAPLARSAAGYELDLESVEHAMAGGARAYLLCNPHNPTGLAFSRSELEQVAAIAARHDAVIVADEIHGPLALDGVSHTPMPALDGELAERTVAIGGASKAWNLAGLKCAVVVAGSARMAETLAALPANLVVHSGNLGVTASIAAFEEGGPWLDALRAYLDANRTLLAELLEDVLPAVRYSPPAAGFLAWLDCRELGLGDDPAAAFLERGRVALSHGPDFGTQGRGYARLNFATSSDLLAEAVVRMASAVA